MLSYLEIKESILVKLFFAANLPQSKYLQLDKFGDHLDHFRPGKPRSFDDVTFKAICLHKQLTDCLNIVLNLTATEQDSKVTGRRFSSCKPMT